MNAHQPPPSHASGVVPSLRRRRTLGVVAGVAAGAVVAAVLSATPVSAVEEADRSAGGGAAPLSVDPQTGQVSKALELFRIEGEGASAIEGVWTYRQPGRYAQPKSGLGVGMTWGNPEIIDDQLVLASGQAVRIDPSTPTGIADHKQLDVELEVLDDPRDPGTEDCVATRACASILTSIDGTVHELDIDGKLAAVRDRKGNAAWWEYDVEGRVSSITGGAKEAPMTVEVEYDGDQRILLHLPSTIDGVSPIVEVELENHLVTGISHPKASAEDPSSAAAALTWTEFGGIVVPSSWTASTGAVTEVVYQKVNNIVAVKELVTKDPETGATLDKPLRVNVDPDGNDAHNYSGWPAYHKNVPLPSTQTSDPLVASNDVRYTYSVAIDDGAQVTTRTYDHLHRLLTERVTVDGAPINTLTHTYPESAGRWPRVPAQYQHPIAIERAVHDPAGHREDRVVTAQYEYDTRGRVIREEGPSTITQTAYDTDRFDESGEGYGLPLSTIRTATTGRDAGTVRSEVAELTSDRTAIATRTTSAQAPGGTAVVTQHLFREYDPATGAVTSERTIDHGDGEPVDRTESTSRAVVEGVVVMTETAADGAVTVTRIDPATGLPIEETTPDGVTTTTRHDLQGRAVHVQKTGQPALDVVYESFAEDGVNRRTTVRESDGYTLRDTADALGRPTLEEDNLVGGRLRTDSWRERSATVYDERGNISSETDAAGLTTTTRYDHADRVVEKTSPDGTRRTMSYDDAVGVTVTELHPAGEDAPAVVTTTVTRDDEGRVIRQETAYADGAPTIAKSFTYTAFGEHESTDEETAKRRTENRFNASGVLTGTRIEADGSLTVDAAYRFDGAGNRLGKDVSGAGAPVAAHTETHDAAGRVLTSTDQEGQTTVHTYNAAGDRVRTDYPDGRASHADYGLGGRLLADWWTRDGDETRQQERRYAYDEHGDIEAVESVADPEGSRIRHAHAPDGKLLASTYADGSTITYTHDDGDRLTSVTDPDGTTTRYERDDAGRIVTVTNGTATMTYEHDGLSRISAITRLDASGAVDSRTTFETTDGGLTSRQTETDATGSVVLDEQRSYTATGLLERTRTTVGADVPDLASGPLQGAREYTTVHAYDGIDRLVGTTVYEGHTSTTAEDEAAAVLTGSRYTHTSGATLESISSFGRDGDRRSDRVLDGTGRTVSITETDADGSQRTTELAWDGAGNLVRDGKGEYRFDIANKLVGWTATDGTGAELEYRIDGTRALRVDADGTRTETFATPGSTTNILLERVTDPAGTTTSHATMAGSGPAAITSDGAITWLLSGHRGDIVMTIGEHGVDSRAVYADYGTRTASESGPAYQPYAYSGAVQDANGRLLLGIRMLDTELGHFTAKDPTNLVARYAYASGDPIQNIDPTGMMSDTWKDVLAGLGDFGGAAIGLFIAGSALVTVITGGAAAPAVAAAVAGLVLEVAATAMTAVLFVDHVRNNGFLSDGVRRGLWGASIGASVLGGASSVGAAAKGARAATKANFLNESGLGKVLKNYRDTRKAAYADLKARWRDDWDLSVKKDWVYQAQEAVGQLEANKKQIASHVNELLGSRHKIVIGARTGAAALGIALTGYVSNPWGTPLSHPKADHSDAPAPSGASVESVPTPAQFAGTERRAGEAPSRGVYEVVNE